MAKNKQKKYIIWFVQFIVVCLLFLLPYYIFGWKLYVGGDDTKLFYSYPLEFLRHVTFFSWVNVSSIGINGPNQYIAPYLAIWSLLSTIITDKTVLNHLGFSLPLVLGFIYFQKAVKELFQLDEQTNPEVLIGSLFFILSPIIIIDQMFVFLITIWLLGVIPILMFYYLRYLHSQRFIYIYQASIWCLIFSFALYGVPWLLGFALPVIIGLFCISFYFKKTELIIFIRLSSIFFGFIFLSQAFWLVGFISPYFNIGQNSFASKFLSKGFIDTYTPTILVTATGTIIYPLLNLFHRQITIDFVWKLKNVFETFYDKIIILKIIYVLIFIFGILNYKKNLKEENKKIFLILLIAFVSSIYLFTVNIGPLKDLFIFLRHVPGFVMFRNFYDKFAPGYVMIYATLITISLIMLTKKYHKHRKIILFSFLTVILINFLPVRETVNSPLWTTDSVQKTVQIPDEYMETMKYIQNNISSTNNILSIPFGTSLYTVVKDKDSDNVYVGVSPVKILSGVNDISGHLSFNFTKEADVVDGYIVNRKYSEFNKMMYAHNINYILLTKNIPKQVLNSWVFSKDLLDAQDNNFLKAITNKKIFTSRSGNYEIYTSKTSNSLIDSKNITFKKISQVKYVIYIKGLKGKQTLSFVDSYHAGWKLFLMKNPSLNFCKKRIKKIGSNSVECKADDKLFDFEDVIYSVAKPIFENTHSLVYEGDNKWEVDSEYIFKNFDNSFYKTNKDGSIDIEMILYFKPQTYFYIGIVISLITFVAGGLLLLFNKNEKK